MRPLLRMTSTAEARSTLGRSPWWYGSGVEPGGAEPFMTPSMAHILTPSPLIFTVSACPLTLSRCPRRAPRPRSPIRGGGWSSPSSAWRCSSTTLDGLIVNIALPTLADRTRRHDPSAPVDRRRLPPRVHRTPARRRGPRRPLRPSAGADRSGSVLFGATSAYAGSVGHRRRPDRRPGAHGHRRRGDLPGHLGDHHQHVHQTHERAKAIGIWSAVSGIGVAAGPDRGRLAARALLVGIDLLRQPARRASLAIAAAVGSSRSRRTAHPQPRLVRLVLSIASIGALVFTIIEAPEYGWLSPFSLTGFAVALALLVAFVVWELRVDNPLLPVRIFENLRFCAASVVGDLGVLRPVRLRVPDHPVLPARPGLHATAGRGPDLAGCGVDRAGVGAVAGAGRADRDQARRRRRARLDGDGVPVDVDRIGVDARTSRSSAR